MVVLGLTGSIGMGKTTVAGALKAAGAAVYDADAAVHRLLGSGGAAVAPVLARFPDAGTGAGPERAVDRGTLGAEVFGDTDALAALEAILHPLVRAGERRFLAASQRRGCRHRGPRHAAPLRDGRRGPLRRHPGRLRPGRGAARAGAGPGEDERGTAGCHPRAPDARCREAPPGGLRDPNRSRQAHLAACGPGGSRPGSAPCGARAGPRAGPGR